MKTDRHMEIVQTACRLFSEKGFEDVSVMDICREAGITKPTFYKYVKSKGDLLVPLYAGVELEDAGIRTVPEIEAAAGPSHYERVMAILFIGYQHGERLGSRMYGQYLIYMLTDPDKTFHFRPEAREAMIRNIREGQAYGEIRNPSDPESIFLCIEHLNFGHSIDWVRYPDYPVKRRLKEDVDRVLDVDWDLVDQHKAEEAVV